MDDPSDDETARDLDRVVERSHLLPEEERAGSDDPEAQAAAILAEGDERTEDRDAAPGTRVEHRTSEETTPPPD
ncbi:hypothetical protein [Rhabdothermincola salaria]|uniref:hypothetical protein n=1 Tax=Rhabdothermincola salaria TaxID=2903142 RepID=UPI001E289241|nr:hypothetical protein [Rhabdothermincola salaria]MCD9622864.1 hypothetical protein [Rhabdothermincola salaria]